MNGKHYDSDPRLSAYVLGELEGDELAAFERELNESPELQAIVEEFRETVELLESEFGSEPALMLHDEQREAITSGCDDEKSAANKRLAATPSRNSARSGLVVTATVATTLATVMLLLAVIPPSDESAETMVRSESSAASNPASTDDASYDMQVAALGDRDEIRQLGLEREGLQFGGTVTLDEKSRGVSKFASEEALEQHTVEGEVDELKAIVGMPLDTVRVSGSTTQPADEGRSSDVMLRDGAVPEPKDASWGRNGIANQPAGEANQLYIVTDEQGGDAAEKARLGGRIAVNPGSLADPIVIKRSETNLQGQEIFEQQGGQDSTRQRSQEIPNQYRRTVQPNFAIMPNESGAEEAGQKEKLSQTAPIIADTDAESSEGLGYYKESEAEVLGTRVYSVDGLTQTETAQPQGDRSDGESQTPVNSFSTPFSGRQPASESDSKNEALFDSSGVVATPAEDAGAIIVDTPNDPYGNIVGGNSGNVARRRRPTDPRQEQGGYRSPSKNPQDVSNSSIVSGKAGNVDNKPVSGMLPGLGATPAQQGTGGSGQISGGGLGGGVVSGRGGPGGGGAQNGRGGFAGQAIGGQTTPQPPTAGPVPAATEAFEFKQNVAGNPLYSGTNSPNPTNGEATPTPGLNKAVSNLSRGSNSSRESSGPAQPTPALVTATPESTPAARYGDELNTRGLGRDQNSNGTVDSYGVTLTVPDVADLVFTAPTTPVPESDEVLNERINEAQQIMRELNVDVTIENVPGQGVVARGKSENVDLAKQTIDALADLEQKLSREVRVVTIPKDLSLGTLPNAPVPDPKDPADNNGNDDGFILEALSGEVTIQDVPGVGIVVRGNKEDADKAMRLLEEVAELEARVKTTAAPKDVRRLKQIRDSVQIRGGRGFGGGGRADDALRRREREQIVARIEQLIKTRKPTPPPARRPQSIPNSESYEPIVENDFLDPRIPSFARSTFSVDVDTASYSNVRRFLDHGQWPDPNAVRLEELVNYFNYDYPEPGDGEPFSVSVNAAECPWEQDHLLVRIGLKGREIPHERRPPSNLVFLVDVSGSMRDQNKLPLVKQGLQLLVEEMTEDDRIAIVTYASQARKVLNSTSGAKKGEILTAIGQLNAGGSTNGEAGIKLAYNAAINNFITNGTNRIILCTDGDFNVGVSSDDELVRMIEEKRRSGVFLSIFGFGMGNLKDAKLEKLANKGNGHYGYIDDFSEARKVFVEELTGMLYAIAKDVKLQVEFNPAIVGAYRLIGYENRKMAAPDFANDRKDAGDIGAGHTVTALYQVVPIDKMPESKLPPLKYGPTESKPAVEGDAGEGDAEPADPVSNEMLTVYLRYKNPNEDQSQLLEEFPLDRPAEESDDLTPDIQWAAAVAEFGMILRGSQHQGDAHLEQVLELARAARGEDEAGHRREFINMVHKAQTIWDRHNGISRSEKSESTELTADQALEKAMAGAKYRKLLKKIKVPDDRQTYGDFKDYGHWSASSYKGHDNLPAGYWVWVAPHWYIWGEQVR